MEGGEERADVPGVPRTDPPWSINPRALIPSFDEGRDDLDVHLKRF